MRAKLNTAELKVAVSLYLTGLSTPQVAQRLGMPISSVRFRLKRAGVLRTIADGVKLSIPTRKKRAERRRRLTPEERAAISAHRQRWAELNARGTRITSQGYVEYTRGPHKEKRVHVVLIERLFGHRLPDSLHVHHIDCDKQNNAQYNLAPLPRDVHARLHRSGRIPKENACLL